MTRSYHERDSFHLRWNQLSVPCPIDRDGINYASRIPSDRDGPRRANPPGHHSPPDTSPPPGCQPHTRAHTGSPRQPHGPHPDCPRGMGFIVRFINQGKPLTPHRQPDCTINHGVANPVNTTAKAHIALTHVLLKFLHNRFEPVGAISICWRACNELYRYEHGCPPTNALIAPTVLRLRKNFKSMCRQYAFTVTLTGCLRVDGDNLAVCVVLTACLD